MTTEKPKPTAQPPVRKNVFALLVGVLLRPKVTFGYLKDNHKRAWWLPALLVLVLSVAPLWAAARLPPAMPEMFPSDPYMREMPGVMPGGMPGEMPVTAPTSSGPNLLQLGGTLLGLLAAWLLWGGALYLASVFLGRSSSFGQMFRLVVWTWLPYGVRGLLQTAYILATGQAIVNTGLSGFVVDKAAPSLFPPGPGQLALASILGQVDVYTLWQLFLVSVGLMAFTNLTRRKAWTAALTIWIVFALLGIVPAILGGMFGSIGGGGPYG